MNNINTEIFKILSQGLSLDELFRSEIERSVNEILKIELTEFLNYEKHDPSGYNSGNSRNGFSTRLIDTKYGAINVKLPRDRNGQFKQATFEPYVRRTNDLETTVLQLYSKGITTSEIASLIEKMYGHSYTKQTVSNITMAVSENVEAFHKRTINKRYVVLYADATMINVRRDTVAKEALHIIVGITPEGYKEILDYRIYPTESASNYKDMLIDLQNRGLKEVLLIVSDGLKGIKDACLNVFTKAKHQSCWVHIQRNIAKLVRVKDRKEIMDLTKELYNADSEKEALEKLNEYEINLIKKYPKVIAHIKSNESLFSFYSFPKSIQRSLYTTNLIESLNKQIKRQTKKKEQFPNEDSLDRFVYNYIIDYNNRFNSRIHKGFNDAQKEIDDMFDEIYPKSII